MDSYLLFIPFIKLCSSFTITWNIPGLVIAVEINRTKTQPLLFYLVWQKQQKILALKSHIKVFVAPVGAAWSLTLPQYWLYWGLNLKRSELCSLLLQGYIRHYQNFQQLSCIMGNVCACFWQGRGKNQDCLVGMRMMASSLEGCLRWTVTGNMETPSRTGRGSHDSHESIRCPQTVVTTKMLRHSDYSTVTRSETHTRYLNYCTSFNPSVFLFSSLLHTYYFTPDSLTLTQFILCFWQHRLSHSSTRRSDSAPQTKINFQPQPERMSVWQTSHGTVYLDYLICETLRW